MTTALDTLPDTKPAPALEPGTYWEGRTLHELVAELAEFTSADAIAAHFLTEGVRGTCGAPGECAIAEWLMANLSDEYGGVSVDGAFIIGFAKGVDPGSVDYRRKAVCVTPLPAAEFISRFDHHVYPKLVK